MSVSLYDGGGGGKTVQQLKRTRFYSCAPGTPGLENSEAARASPRNSKNRIRNRKPKSDRCAPNRLAAYTIFLFRGRFRYAYNICGVRFLIIVSSKCRKRCLSGYQGRMDKPTCFACTAAVDGDDPIIFLSRIESPRAHYGGSLLLHRNASRFSRTADTYHGYQERMKKSTSCVIPPPCPYGPSRIFDRRYDGDDPFLWRLGHIFPIPTLLEGFQKCTAGIRSVWRNDFFPDDAGFDNRFSPFRRNNSTLSLVSTHVRCVSPLGKILFRSRAYRFINKMEKKKNNNNNLDYRYKYILALKNQQLVPRKFA